ncbi:GPR1/FUN34/yaaH family-domain-containing protein [Myxozyma melibiosi]|uniref:GPR1/FUN34/yaaH family-domain-containing protein n=1 Tax=Myxozyma melibiosi TaxID=54550 RepID=A0ABR1F4M8_9ASCO
MSTTSTAASSTAAVEKPVNLNHLEAGNNEETDSQDQLRVHRIVTHTDDPDLIKIGSSWVSRRELMMAFGGTLNPGYSAPPSRKFGNPAPLGLCAFGLTTFVLCMANVQVRGVSNPSTFIGLGYFYGGIIQLLAGMWEMAIENTFGATALSSFGGFWLSFAAIETDAFGIVSAYGTDTHALNTMLGIYLMGWFIFTFGLVLCTLRSTVAFFALFFTLDICFMLLGIGKFYPDNSGVTIAGGVFGLMAAFLAFYNAFAGLANNENSLIVIKPIAMPWNPIRYVKNKST